MNCKSTSTSKARSPSTFAGAIPPSRGGRHRESTGEATFVRAKDVGIEAYWQRKNAPPTKRGKTFRELAAALDHFDRGRLCAFWSLGHGEADEDERPPRAAPALVGNLLNMSDEKPPMPARSSESLSENELADGINAGYAFVVALDRVSLEATAALGAQLIEAKQPPTLRRSLLFWVFESGDSHRRFSDSPTAAGKDPAFYGILARLHDRYLSHSANSCRGHKGRGDLRTMLTLTRTVCR